MSVAILLAVLPALLAAAAVLDLTTYKIPNVITGAMILLFVAFLVIVALSGHSMSWSETGLHVLAGLLGLLVGMGMFAAGWVGGGDAKLFTAALLWLGFDALFDYAILVGLLGGALTFGLIALRRHPLPSFMAKQTWLARLADREGDVPYGVALALAALIVLPDTHVFQLAVAN